MNAEIDALLDCQEGVISRCQALAAGAAPHDLRRLLRRRDWVPVHPGVYVAHTGPLTWRQRAWAAVLWAWPAALWGQSSLQALDRTEGREATGTLHLAVGRHRSGLRPPVGVVLHHEEHLDAKVLWNAGPPRVRVEDAVLDAAVAASTDLGAVALMAHWVQRRRTTPARLLEALERRPRVPRRRWLGDVLADLAAGTCSVLEHGYLVRVERPHRLPRPERQRPSRSSQGLVYRDADYGALLVELDGRLFHDSPRARERDLERDLDAAAERRATLRLGWAQVFERPCATAAKVVAVMRHHGIVVAPRRCGSRCPVS